MKGDVTATAGTVPYTGATSGDWTAGAVELTSYPVLTVAGTDVIHKAECTFSFLGKNSGGAVTGSSTVTLTAGAQPLQGGLSNVLVDGNWNKDAYGNTLNVSATGVLRTG
ncbi:hypothetical protein [Caenispirillum salinarum]|uniref:hypothetical protein n=1 Tax=Caenispirillum salinarum TaxID=859058 RepID=UPI00384C2F78